MRFVVFCCLLLISHFAHAKVLIISHAFNRPDFIEPQFRCLKKFLMDDHELVIFNDADSSKHHNAINAVCRKLGIRCIPIPQQIHAHLYPVTLPKERFYTIPSNRHADAIRYSLQKLGFHHDGIVALMDSDLFLIRPLSIAQLLQDCEIASIISPAITINERDYSYNPPKWKKIPDHEFLWPGAVFMKMNQLPNKEELDFTPAVYLPDFLLDTGGQTFFYLKNHPEVRVKQLDVFHDRLNISYLNIHEDWPVDVKIREYEKLDFNRGEINFLLRKPKGLLVEFGVEFGYQNHFLHYRAGSYESGNLIGHSKEQVSKKSLWVREFIKKLLATP